jgi:hypothetical protein
VVDPSLVEHKQVPSATLELDENGMRIVFAKPSADDLISSADECKEIEHSPKTGGYKVKTCKVRRIHVNSRWIETDIGKIWVGAKGSSLKVGQIIRVLNGELFLKRTEPKPSLVRI